jgi:hypothetical protein
MCFIDVFKLFPYVLQVSKYGFCYIRQGLLKVTAIYVAVKVKVTLEQAMKAQRGSRGIALLFL